jgi:hypothetical protein
MNDADFDDEWDAFEKVATETATNGLTDKEKSIMLMREAEEEADHKLSNDLFSMNETINKNDTSSSSKVIKPNKNAPLNNILSKQPINKKPFKKYNKPKQAQHIKTKERNLSSDEEQSDLDYYCSITDKIYSKINDKR